MPEPLLEVENLSVSYVTDAAEIGAVDRVTLTLNAGEFLGVVGESGCGKSTLVFAIAQLLSPPAEITSGRVVFRGQDLIQLSDSELRHVRWRDYSVVMQSAMNALNPMKSIGAQFKDTMRAHDRVSPDAIRTRSAEVLRLVGIDAAFPPPRSRRLAFPHLEQVKGAGAMLLLVEAWSLLLPLAFL